MLLLVAAIVCAPARGYDGPREAPYVESQVEPHEPRAVGPPRQRVYAPLKRDQVVPRGQPPQAAPIPYFARQLRMPGAGPLDPPREPPVAPQRSGRGLLIAGGVLAAAGAVVTSVGLAASLQPCGDFCEPYEAVFTSITAPVPWLVGIGMLGGGMQHRSHMIASRRLAERRTMKPRRRGVFASGITLLVVGAGAIVGTWWAPGINLYAQLAGGPLAIAGAVMTGSARGRRLAIKDHFAVAPVVTRSTALLSIRARWRCREGGAPLSASSPAHSEGA